MRPSIVMLLPHYLPGYKAGGPIRSIANMVEALGDEFSFHIITKDRDWTESTPYPGIRTRQWLPVGKADVLYLSPGPRSLANLVGALREYPEACLYVNGVFSRFHAILPMILHAVRVAPQLPVIVAPRGEFYPGALSIRAGRKAAFLGLVRSLGLGAKVIWHASSEQEGELIRRLFGRLCRVVVAPDLPDSSATGENGSAARKQPGTLRVAFLARISPNKNLQGALSMLHSLRGRVTFDIYGPIDDQPYWEQCRQGMRNLSENVTAAYRGVVPHHLVHSVLGSHDVLLFPTLGENYGHVIVEALAAGCPVIVSDQTPWQNLAQKGVGWDVPLSRPDLFQAVLQSCIDLDAQQFQNLSDRARKFGAAVRADPKAIWANRDLFHQAFGENSFRAKRHVSLSPLHIPR